MGLNLEISYPSTARLIDYSMENGIPVSTILQKSVEQLKSSINTALKTDETLLEATLQSLFPIVWQLRLEAIPFLTEFDLTEGVQKIDAELEEVGNSIPDLKETVDQLKFGLTLMVQLTEQLLAQNPLLFQQMTEVPAPQLPSYQSLIAEIASNSSDASNIIIQFLQGSLMLELLLLAQHQIANRKLPLEKAMYHELQYLSAVAVQQYAEALGIDKTKMPWHKPAFSDFQQFLLEGPLASEEQLQYIKEKSVHFNTCE